MLGWSFGPIYRSDACRNNARVGDASPMSHRSGRLPPRDASVLRFTEAPQSERDTVTAHRPEADLPARRVLVVDGHQVFADLLALALSAETDLECVGTAFTIASALELATLQRPDVVIADIQLGNDSGLDAARRIRGLMPGVVIVITSTYDDPGWAGRAAQAGANAFALKSGSLQELLILVRNARTGGMLIAPSLFGRATSQSAERRRHVEKLTPREQDVLILMGQGTPPVAIARILHITVNTCRGYVKSIHAKLGACSQLEAVVTAQRLGLIPVEQQQACVPEYA